MFNKKYKEEIERLKAENAKLLEKTKSLEEISKEIENKKVNQHKEFFEVPIDKVANVLYTKYSIKDKIDLNPICEDYIASKGM